MVNPFAYEEYRKDKIRQKIEETRAQRVQLKVNIVLTIEFTGEKYLIFVLCYHSEETCHPFLSFPILSFHLFLIFGVSVICPKGGLPAVSSLWTWC